MDNIVLKILCDLYTNQWINTNKLIQSLSEVVDNPLEVFSYLIKEKFVERLLDEHIDIVSFKTERLSRLLKIKQI